VVIEEERAAGVPDRGLRARRGSAVGAAR
jgi:hypothetical protein